MNTRFEWDGTKAASNLRKHGLSFETAVRVFADPFLILEPDRIEDGEERWHALGAVEGQLVVLVAHVWRHDADDDGSDVEVIRIISARKADRKERRRYEEETR